MLINASACVKETNMAVTLDDIAKAAKVSPSTVSRVITGNSTISESTKKRVLKIMKEMNYQPNMVARSLANKAARTIGVVVSSKTEGALQKAFQYPTTSETLGGVSVTAYKSKYNVLLSGLSMEDDGMMKIREIATSGMTDGIIYYFSRINDPVIEELKKLKIPFVVIGKPSDETGVNWVGNDCFSAAYRMTELMIEKGRKKIAFIGASPNYVISVDMVNGYKTALERYGIPVQDDLVVQGKFITGNGYEMMENILSRGIIPDGILAQDDQVAFGIIKKIKEIGMVVPEDISVAGFNNVPVAEFYVPSLTTVEMNAFEVGKKACELLLSCIHNKDNTSARTIVPSEVIIRSSI